MSCKHPHFLPTHYCPTSDKESKTRHTQVVVCITTKVLLQCTCQLFYWEWKNCNNYITVLYPQKQFFGKIPLILHAFRSFDTAQVPHVKKRVFLQILKLYTETADTFCGSSEIIDGMMEKTSMMLQWEEAVPEVSGGGTISHPPDQIKKHQNSARKHQA